MLGLGSSLITKPLVSSSGGSSALVFPVNPLVRWQFDGNLLDSAGSRNLIQNGGGFSAGPFSGKQAFELTAAYQGASIVDDFVSENTTYTFSGWVRPDNLSFPEWANIFSYADASSLHTVLSVISNTNRWDWRWGSGSDKVTTSPIAAGPLIEGVWNFFTVTFNFTTSEAVIYSNGVEIARRTNGNSGTPVSGQTFTVGHNNAANYGQFFGAIHDLCFYNSVLTPDQIRNLNYSYYMGGPIAIDKFPTNNAASVVAEANLTFPWRTGTGTDPTITSVASTDPESNGLYAIRAEALADGWRTLEIDLRNLNLVPHTARIRMRINTVNGGVFNWVNVSSVNFEAAGSDTPTVDGTWYTRIVTFTPTTEVVTMRFYVDTLGGGYDAGQYIEISELEITED